MTGNLESHEQFFFFADLLVLLVADSNECMQNGKALTLKSSCID